MSIRFAALPQHDDRAAGSSGEDDDDDLDDDFDGWSSDQGTPCRSLFDDETFLTAADALAYDKATHGFDLDARCRQWNLDLHGRIRLINFIRKHKSTAADVDGLIGTESFFDSDDYLTPVIQDDPLLQLDFDDDWSDDENSSADPPSDLPSALRRIQLLEEKLSRAKNDLSDYRRFVTQNQHLSSIAEIVNDPGPSTTGAPRDDDSHYFQSYEYNDIHAVMIQDKVRTSSYASFILTNPILFRDAIVLDVGCGTGVLSLFAAKSGAKHVYAVDASSIADKAEKIVRANGLHHVVTVIHGKVEDIDLPGVDHVDIIISEWMGYALLYESMLDSVLCARDRFLRPNGVMAPSQCRMMLALCDGAEIVKDRVEFWNDVYGFDLSEMARNVYGDAILDIVDPESVVSDPYLLKDLHLQTISPRQLDFVSAFTLTSTSAKRTKIHALVLYFDVFFTTTGVALPAQHPVRLIKPGDVALAEVWPVGGKPPPERRPSVSGPAALKAREDARVVSFSTGPTSQATHWTQTVFLLRDPIVAEEGTVVDGTFRCRKSEKNARELDVEIHYQVKKGDAPPSEVTVQIYKVR